MLLLYMAGRTVTRPLTHTGVTHACVCEGEGKGGHFPVELSCGFSVPVATSPST